jgi:hypothetical protein
MTGPAWLKGALVFALTLIAGVVIGMGVERRGAPRHDGAAMRTLHLVHGLKDRLGLDSAQQDAIAAILARRQGAVDSTWHTMQPHLRATLDSALADIVGVLRPDQMERYRQMVESMHGPVAPH